MNNAIFNLLQDRFSYDRPELFGPYFPAFGLNTERYSVSLRIQPNAENADQNNSEYRHFLGSDVYGTGSFSHRACHGIKHY